MSADTFVWILGGHLEKPESFPLSNSCRLLFLNEGVIILGCMSHKPSPLLFFNLFYIVCNSENDMHDHELNELHTDLTLLSSFTNKWGDFIKFLILTSPLNLTNGNYFWSSSTGSNLYYKGRFAIYLSWPHFRSTTHSYNIKLDDVSAEEVMMREYFKFLYQGLGYEEGFRLGKVLASLQRKKLIDTRSIMSDVN